LKQGAEDGNSQRTVKAIKDMQVALSGIALYCDPALSQWNLRCAQKRLGHMNVTLEEMRYETLRVGFRAKL
jgi:hypothetical protein